MQRFFEAAAREVNSAGVEDACAAAWRRPALRSGGRKVLEHGRREKIIARPCASTFIDGLSIWGMLSSGG